MGQRLRQPSGRPKRVRRPAAGSCDGAQAGALGEPSPRVAAASEEERLLGGTLERGGASPHTVRNPVDSGRLQPTAASCETAGQARFPSSTGTRQSSHFRSASTCEVLGGAPGSGHPSQVTGLSGGSPRLPDRLRMRGPRGHQDHRSGRLGGCTARSQQSRAGVAVPGVSVTPW